MKECINPACRQELEDYELRCPHCGVAQKRITIPDKKEEVTTQTARTHPFIIVFLSITIFLNIVFAFIYLFPKWAFGSSLRDIDVTVFRISSLFCLINIGSLIALLLRKKGGFVTLCISCVISTILTCVVYTTFPWGLIGLLLYYGILHIKRDGVSYWSTLT